MAEQILKVRIVTPKQVIFDGSAISISSVNSAGKFDILARHANFVTIVEKSPIIVRPVQVHGQPKKKDLTFSFPVAIIYTSKDIVSIYTDISLK